MSFVFAYKFIFFKIYSWNEKAFGKSDLPEWNGVLMLTLFTFSNIISIVLFVDKLFHLGAVEKWFASTWLIIVVASANLLVNYLLLLYKKKYVNIIEVCKNVDARQGMKYKYLTFLYFFASITLLAWMIVLTALKT